MDFNEEHKVIIDTLDPAEARAFVKFLRSEIIRHGDDILQAYRLIDFVIVTRLNGKDPADAK